MDYTEMETMIEEMVQDPMYQKIFLISMIVSFAIVLILELVMYILGAYGRRNKVIREQEIADKAAKAEAEKVKKINYGGLPGTKPKKRK